MFLIWKNSVVLILVLVEDTLREDNTAVAIKATDEVLILVLVEDTLREC